MPNKSIYLSIFQQIIESIPDIALIVDKNGIITALNSQIKTHLGYNPAELIGKLVTDLPFFTDSSKVIAVDYFQKRMAGEIIEPYELELKSKDGNFKSGLIHAQKISDPGVELEIDFIVVEMQLVENPSDKPNEFESTKKALEESEARYKFLVNSSDEYILIVSYTGKILFANRATVTNFGFSEEEIIGKPITSFLAPNSASKVGPAILQAFLGKNPGKFDIYTRTKAGGYRIIENNSKSLTFINHGNTKGLLIFGRDVTEQRQAESKIEKSENRFQALFQHTPIAYLMFDQDGKITDANPPSLTLLSTTLSDIKNKTIEELALFDSDALPKLKAAFQKHFQIMV